MSDQARPLAFALFAMFLAFGGGAVGFLVMRDGLTRAVADRDAALKERNATRAELAICREEVRRLVQVSP